MCTDLILKEKAVRWNADQAPPALREEIRAQDPRLASLVAAYSRGQANAFKARTFDREALARRGWR
jgi:xylose isomerase